MPVPVEAEQALFLDERFKRALVRRDDLDVDLVVITDLFDETIGFRVQTACVEAEDLDVFVQFPGHIHQHDVFGAAEGDPQFVTEMLESQFQNVLCRLVRISRRQFSDVERLAHQAAS